MWRKRSPSSRPRPAGARSSLARTRPAATSSRRRCSRRARPASTAIAGSPSSSRRSTSPAPRPRAACAALRRWAPSSRRCGSARAATRPGSGSQALREAGAVSARIRDLGPRPEEATESLMLALERALDRIGDDWADEEARLEDTEELVRMAVPEPEGEIVITKTGRPGPRRTSGTRRRPGRPRRADARREQRQRRLAGGRPRLRRQRRHRPPRPHRRRPVPRLLPARLLRGRRECDRRDGGDLDPPLLRRPRRDRRRPARPRRPDPRARPPLRHHLRRPHQRGRPHHPRPRRVGEVPDEVAAAVPTAACRCRFRPAGCEHVFVSANPNDAGNLAEAAFQFHAVEAGARVLVPAVEHAPYDVVLDVDGVMIRVQVKSASLSRDGAVVVARLRRSRHTARSGYVAGTYSADEVDAFGVYCAEVDRCYLIPFADTHGYGTVHLRLGAGAKRTARIAKIRRRLRVPWGCSSAGRASRWQREGQGFEPPQLHFIGIS